MSVRFYFVRHGQSEANLRDDYYNDEEAKLTNLGKAQAVQLGDELKDYGIEFKAVFCSPYRRAIETCEIAMSEAGLGEMSVVIDERLGERKFDGIIGRIISDKRNRKLYDYNSNQSVLERVETLEALEERVQGFINDVISEYHEGDFLVFSHGAFGLVFRAVVQGRPETGNLFDWRLLKNCEVIVLEV